MAADLWLETSKGATLSLYDTPIMVEDGWVPNAAARGRPGVPVWETIPVTIRGTSAQIKTAIRNIKQMEYTAIKYAKDMTRNDAVRLCLEDQDGDEHYTVIIDSDGRQISHPGTSAWLDEGSVQIFRYELRLKRMPYWDRYTPVVDTTSSVSDWGGTGTLANPYGTHDARIDYGYVDSIGLGRMWLGIRQEREGLSHYDPLVEIEDGSAYSGVDTTFVTKSGASGGTPNCMQTTFTTVPGLVKRAHIDLTDYADIGYEDHYVGRYLVLGSVMSETVGAKFGLQLHYGYLGSSSYAVNNEVLFECTYSGDWRVIPLGIVSIPPLPRPEYGSAIPQELGRFILVIGAEKVTAGAATMWFDGMILMPTDHLMVASRNPIGSVPRKYWFYSRAEGNRHILLGETVLDIPDFMSHASFDDWAVPLDNSKFVLVTEWGGNRPRLIITNTSDVRFQWYPRSHHYMVSRT